MKKINQQVKKTIRQILVIPSRGVNTPTRQAYSQSPAQLVADEARLNKRLAEIHAKIFETDLGAVILPQFIELSRIRQLRQEAIENFQTELIQLQEANPGLIKRGLRVFKGDFLELTREHIGKTRRKPRNICELATVLPYFDWRLSGTVPRVRDQQHCNSCWAFAATAAFESRLMYNVNRIRLLASAEPAPLTKIGLSVQGVLDCVTGGDCGGGDQFSVFGHFVKNGARLLDFNEKGLLIDDRKDLLGKKGKCTEREREGGIKALTWDFVSERNPLQVPKTEMAIRKMKKALLDYGPLVVWIAKDENRKFDFYRDCDYPQGVYNIDTAFNPSHIVLLTGWDEGRKAWIIQNSYGPMWGGTCVEPAKINEHFPWTMDYVEKFLQQERGCMYISYGVSSVGQLATWIETPLINVDNLVKAKAQSLGEKAGKRKKVFTD